MIKVYCDTSGYRPWLRQLGNKKRIILIGFPYENRNKKIHTKCEPTRPTWNQMNLSWNKADFPWNNSPSKNFDEITKILSESGQNIYVDAQHLDSAYKNHCRIFLTNDIHHIIKNKNALESLLDIKIFHPTKDKEPLMKYILALESQF